MTQSNIKIAVTGGIGSGKSAVCKIIRDNGYPVFSCDEIYSELLSSPEFTESIGREFEGVLNADKSLNRKLLAEAVFGNDVALKKLNAITHPAIMEVALKKMEGHKVSFLEVPLLFENGFEKLFDNVIVVLREKEERINSVIVRDNTSREKVILRLNSQFDYDNFNFAEYYVIHNSENFDLLEQKTLEILQKIINTKKNRKSRKS